MRCRLWGDAQTELGGGMVSTWTALHTSRRDHRRRERKEEQVCPLPPAHRGLGGSRGEEPGAHGPPKASAESVGRTGRPAHPAAAHGQWGRALPAELPVATETPRGIFFVLTVGWLVWPWGASPLHTAFL